MYQGSEKGKLTNANIDALNARMHNPEENKTARIGIGLGNIYRRIRTLYPEGGDLSIDAKERDCQADPIRGKNSNWCAGSISITKRWHFNSIQNQYR